MQSAVVKRSIVISGHKTSVSIEDPFWHCLKEIGRSERKALSALVAGIDGGRQKNSNLSSAIRLFVLDRFSQAGIGRVHRRSRSCWFLPCAGPSKIAASEWCTLVSDEVIFIVDDDPEARSEFSDVFRQAGYQVVTFSDGGSFLRAARNWIPACILLDTYILSSSGRDLLTELDAKHYLAPIVMLSGRRIFPAWLRPFGVVLLTSLISG